VSKARKRQCDEPTNLPAAESTDSAITIEVRFFAGPREAIGKSEVEVEVPPGATVETLIDLLRERYPALRPHTRFLSVAVNRVYAGAQTVLQDGDEVACLPPVGGG
jgi:molybdopterin converting factor subunit 1